MVLRSFSIRGGNAAGGQRSSRRTTRRDHSTPVNHSKPLSREDIADFLKRLDAYGGNRTTAIALRLLLLTFVRTVEMRKAEWTDFNLDESEWRIPAEK